jgi:hypothetical protein
MSALTPSNGKYRRSWLTWGSQAVPSDTYKNNYDKINWETPSKGIVKKELSNPYHYEIKFEKV